MKKAPQLGLSSTHLSFVKVKLFYQTWDAQHLRSQVLENEYRARPPFVEDVSVLLDPAQVFFDLTCFHPIFEALRQNGVVKQNDRLKSFEVREEDYRTLAYYVVSLDHKKDFR